jgi:hypothetical protein
MGGIECCLVDREQRGQWMNRARSLKRVDPENGLGVAVRHPLSILSSSYTSKAGGAARTDIQAET